MLHDGSFSELEDCMNFGSGSLFEVLCRRGPPVGVVEGNQNIPSPAANMSTKNLDEMKTMKHTKLQLQSEETSSSRHRRGEKLQAPLLDSAPQPLVARAHRRCGFGTRSWPCLPHAMLCRPGHPGVRVHCNSDPANPATSGRLSVSLGGATVSAAVRPDPGGFDGSTVNSGGKWNRLREGQQSNDWESDANEDLNHRQLLLRGPHGSRLCNWRVFLESATGEGFDSVLTNSEVSMAAGLDMREVRNSTSVETFLRYCK